MNICATHNMYEREMLDIRTAHGGYTVSTAWEMLDREYPEESTFILVKEDLQTVTDHLVYGHFHGLYDTLAMTDFRKYWGIDLTTPEILPYDLGAKMENYYTRIEKHFNRHGTLLTIDLRPYEGSWNRWILSDDFVKFIMALPARNTTLTLNASKMQDRVMAKKSFPYFDYLKPGDWYGVPTGMAIGTFFGSLPIPFSNDPRENSYVDHLLREYRKI
jgi:hypothetical protein